ncbi:hypothetical protein SEEM1594_16380 [Salmonella enterica subsp. enterica serovar Muenchen str. baa1594]|nr:hypothetical protein SEEM1594_16380 [Salmonella enterica subsp. enterica serovar Muenchen str. baa1594]
MIWNWFIAVTQSLITNDPILRSEYTPVKKILRER